MSKLYHIVLLGVMALSCGALAADEAAIAEAQRVVTSGVRGIGCKHGRGSAIVLASEDAFGLARARNRDGTSAVAVGGVFYGRGRAVLFGNREYLTHDVPYGDLDIFERNVFKFLSGNRAEAKIGIFKSPEILKCFKVLGIEGELFTDVAELSKYAVVAAVDFPKDSAKAFSEYVAAGGSLAAAVSWTEREDVNRVLSPMGILLSGLEADIIGGHLYTMDLGNISPLARADRALVAASKGALREGESRRQVRDTLGHLLSAFPPNPSAALLANIETLSNLDEVQAALASNKRLPARDVAAWLTRLAAAFRAGEDKFAEVRACLTSEASWREWAFPAAVTELRNGSILAIYHTSSAPDEKFLVYLREALKVEGFDAIKLVLAAPRDSRLLPDQYALAMARDLEERLWEREMAVVTGWKSDDNREQRLWGIRRELAALAKIPVIDPIGGVAGFERDVTLAKAVLKAVGFADGVITAAEGRWRKEKGLADAHFVAIYPAAKKGQSLRFFAELPTERNGGSSAEWKTKALLFEMVRTAKGEHYVMDGAVTASQWEVVMRGKVVSGRKSFHYDTTEEELTEFLGKLNTLANDKFDFSGKLGMDGEITLSAKLK